MNYLELIFKLLDSLAWPIVVAIGIFIVRKELRSLLRSLSKLKYKEFEADFALKAEKLATEATKILHQNNPVKLPPPRARSAEEILNELIAISPKTAVIESFDYVDQAIRQAGIRLGIAKDEFYGVRNMVNEMENRNIIPEQVESLFFEMRRTRDELSHSMEIEIAKKDAEKFIDTARLLASFFSKL